MTNKFRKYIKETWDRESQRDYVKNEIGTVFPDDADELADDFFDIFDYEEDEGYAYTVAINLTSAEAKELLDKLNKKFSDSITKTTFFNIEEPIFNDDDSEYQIWLYYGLDVNSDVLISQIEEFLENDKTSK